MGIVQRFITSRWGVIFHNFYAVLAELIFPYVCAGCGSWGEVLCAECDAKITGEWVDITSELSYIKNFSALCASFPVWARFLYSREMRKVILSWKHEDIKELECWILQKWRQGLDEFNFLNFNLASDKVREQKGSKKYLVVCAPSGKARRKAGRLVALRLAQQVADCWGIECKDVLRKPSALQLGYRIWCSYGLKGLYVRVFLPKVRSLLADGKYQVADKKVRKDKRDSVFACCDLRGRQVILVDDVVTTGATLYACQKAIEQAGGKVLLALSLGYVQRI